MKLTVKNWKDFQHYKDRAPPWIKLHKGLLDNYEYQRLPLASRALAPMIWLLASESDDGSIDYDTAKLAFRLHCTELDVIAGLMPLIDNGFLIADSEALASCKQETRLETETEVEEEVNTFVASKLPNCPHQEIISIYAEALPTLPQPRMWEGAREKNLAARWRWVLSDLKANGKPCEATDGIDFFRRLFGYVSESDFLTGRAGTWSADLGWIVKAENFAKIIQGNYENKAAA